MERVYIVPDCLPIRFLPKERIMFNKFYIFNTQKEKNMPLFLVEEIPTENLFKTLGRYLPYLAITCWMPRQRVYIVPDSLPYTFSPLSIIFNILYYLLIPQKKPIPLFLVERIPKENPFKPLGGYLPCHASTVCWMYLQWIYIVPDSLPYQLHISLLSSTSFNTPKENHAPFLGNKGSSKKILLRHSGDISPAMQVQYVGCIFSGYIWFLILSHIRFLPYQLSLLSSISFNTSKENHAPFLGGKDPQRKPFQDTRGIPPLPGKYSMLEASSSDIYCS